MTDKSKKVYEAMRPTPNERYVIVPTNYEYNDEGYTQQGLGRPIKIYESAAEADAERARLEYEKRAAMAEDELSSYCGYCGWRDDKICTHPGLKFFVVVPCQEVPIG